VDVLCCCNVQTGTSVVIRGKGSVKEGRIGTKDGKPLPGADEPLHAYITSDVEENVKKGADRVRHSNGRLLQYSVKI